MSNPAKCPRCGAEMPGNFAGAGCPSCLLQQGLSPSSFISGIDSEKRENGPKRRRDWIPPTPAELQPRFPQFEIVELLGQGGMGVVYKVKQPKLDRWAALKILSDEFASDPSFSERFLREARALAQLAHQHIVVVFEFGESQGVYYLLMEYVDGVTLRQLIGAGQIVPKDALIFVTQICDALQFAHEAGVVHRDIKPENIMIDKRGRVKIADFGLAKMLGVPVESQSLTETHQVMGTPVYMAPEQMEGRREVDHRADIFSLGVVFYELLTGELPLGRFAPPSQKFQIDIRLDEVVLKTLEKEPSLRYQTASQVKVDVETIQSQVQVVSPSSTGSAVASSSHPSAGGLLSSRAAAILRSMSTGGRFAQLGQVLIVALLTACLVLLIRTPLQESGRGKETASHIADDQPTPAEPLPERERSAVPVDANDNNQIVLFADEKAYLNPRYASRIVDGNRMISTEHELIINQALAKIHRQYLEVESRYLKLETQGDGSQVSIVQKSIKNLGVSTNLADEVWKLQDDFWKEIDVSLPLDLQRYLRMTLPLQADTRQAYSPPKNGADMLPTTVEDNNGQAFASRNIQFNQVLGWSAEKLPVRIVISRRGNWYRWSIKTFLGPNLWVEDHGETPELPSALRRFWRQDPSVGPESDVDRTAHLESRSASYVWLTREGPMLPVISATRHFTAAERASVNEILAKYHAKYRELERRHSKIETDSSGRRVTSIESFASEVSGLISLFWNEIEASLPLEKQKYLRQNLPLFADEFEPLPTDDSISGRQKIPLVSNQHKMRDPQLFGWKQDKLPLRVVIGGFDNQKYVTWLVDYNGPTGSYLRGDGETLPASLRRFAE